MRACFSNVIIAGRAVATAGRDGIGQRFGPWFIVGLALLVAPSAVFCATEEDPARKENAAEATAADTGEEGGKEPSLSFTDEDLKKYRRKPADPEAEDGDDPADEADRTAPRRKAGKSRPPEQMGVVVSRKPKPKTAPAATPPADDPLKAHRDREAKEAFRTGQLETLRGRIATIESRLAYLQQRRLAILDPLRIMPAAQNDADRQAEASSGSRDLLETVEKEIETLQESLENTRKKLVAIETRFGHQAGGR